MSTPPQSTRPDAGMEKLFSRLPGLIEQARKGTMLPQAITQLRQLLRDRRPAIEAWYKANSMPSPFPTLPPSINPAVPVPAGSAANSPRSSPAPSAAPATTAGSNQTPAAARPPAARPGPVPQRPPVPAQTAAPVGLQPTAPPLARPPAGASTTSAAVRPPGVRPPTAAATPTASAANTPSPGVSGSASRTGTPSATSVPKVTSWTDVFNMTAEQRRSWFDAVPGSEATYNKILEDARKKHMAMRQGDGSGGSRAGSPAPGGNGGASRSGSPAPTGGPGSPATVNSKDSGRPAAAAAAATPANPASSGTRAIRPVNQNMPLPNLAIPPGARRGSTTDAPPTPSAAPTPTTAPENRPPAGIHSLSQDKIRFYMSLSDAQGQVLPHDQKQLWLWLKKLIQETKQQSANKQAAATAQRPGVKPGLGGQPAYGAGFRMPSVPAGGLSMANLNEEISKLYTDGKAPTMAQLRELCMRGGLAWTAQMENLVGPYASDRPKQGSGGNPIEIPPTPAAQQQPTTNAMVPRTLKEHIHENVRRVVEYEIGNAVDDDLVTVFQDLAGDVFQEVLSGGVALARCRRREGHTLEVRDVAEVARQTMGITIPGFGLEQAMIGKRKAAPSRMNERHLKKLRAVQQAKDRDAGRI